MNSKKINQLATELTPSLSDITIIGDPSTGISKKITLSQMASLFTGTVEEYANLAAFPLVGTADTIYIALDTNVIYRWNTGTSAYVELSPNIVTSLVFSDANGFDGTISLVGSTATLTITTALTTGSVPFIGASGALSQDNANLFFDDTNNRLGINTNAPTTALDVFGSGIIGRLNGTSTNNAYLGFASAGTNKWSIGNVQSDHRFRIYSEANTSELVSVLQTGEFGIGIANPTTKLHIDGGSTALIANLDADVSVAKSVSFRSDNSNRFNIEVSGLENGGNAGANFFIKRYSDAGSLIDTPLTIMRQTGAITLATTLNLSEIQASTSAGITLKSNGGTSVALFGAGGGAGTTLYGGLSGTSATFSGFVGINGSPATGFPLEAYINSSTSYSSTSRGNIMRVYNSSTSANIFAGIELGGAGTANDGLAGINAVVTGSGSAALTFYTRDSNTFAERLRITSAGNIGINMSTPSDYSGYTTLHINGKSGAAGGLLRLTAFDNSSSVNIYAANGINFNTTSAVPFIFLTQDTERMRINSSGNVTVNENIRSYFGFVNFRGGTGRGGMYDYATISGSGTDYGNTLFAETGYNIYFCPNGSTTKRMTINTAGNIIFSGQVYGNTVGSPRTLYIQSDGEIGGISSIEKSKKNINSFDTDWLMKLKPVSFNYRKKDEEGNYTEEHYEELFYGLIAEESELVNKEICTYNEETLVGIEYSKLITPMLKAIQELKAEIEILKAK